MTHKSQEISTKIQILYFQGHKSLAIFESALEAIVHLSNAVGPDLNPHLKNILGSVSVFQLF